MFALVRASGSRSGVPTLDLFPSGGGHGPFECRFLWLRAGWDSFHHTPPLFCKGQSVCVCVCLCGHLIVCLFLWRHHGRGEHGRSA